MDSVGITGGSQAGEAVTSQIFTISHQEGVSFSPAYLYCHSVEFSVESMSSRTVEAERSTMKGGRSHGVLRKKDKLPLRL